MAACAVCQARATVYCHNDAALLCDACDESIHSASVVAQRHTRVAVCGVCQSEPSKVYCHNDASFFCEGCNASVHLSNPLACTHKMSAAAEVAPRSAAAPAPAPAEHSDSAAAVVPVLEHSATSSPATPSPEPFVSGIPPTFDLPLTKPVSMNELRTLWGGDEFKVGAWPGPGVIARTRTA
jgi:hypothetical protein